MLTKVAVALTVGFTVMVWELGVPGQIAFPVVEAVAETVKEMG